MLLDSYFWLLGGTLIAALISWAILCRQSSVARSWNMSFINAVRIFKTGIDPEAKW